MTQIASRTSGPARIPPIERLLPRLSIDSNGCWVVPEAMRKLNGGYGQMGVGRTGKIATTHVTYEYFIAPVPDGLVLDHLCRNPPCCNPFHLEPVTQAVNLSRGRGTQATARRTNVCSRGHSDWYVRPDGRRKCRPCAREQQRKTTNANNNV